MTLTTFRMRLGNLLQQSEIFTSGPRRHLLRAMGITIGDTSIVRYGCTFSAPNIMIGDHVLINNDCHFDGEAAISVEDRVAIGPGVWLCTSTHEIGGSGYRAGADIAKPITIKAGSWIGAAAIILPGITVESGCVIGAGSVLTRGTEPDGVYVGSPARRVRDLDP